MTKLAPALNEKSDRLQEPNGIGATPPAQDAIGAIPWGLCAPGATRSARNVIGEFQPVQSGCIPEHEPSLDCDEAIRLHSSFRLRGPAILDFVGIGSGRWFAAAVAGPTRRIGRAFAPGRHFAEELLRALRIARSRGGNRDCKRAKVDCENSRKVEYRVERREPENPDVDRWLRANSKEPRASCFEDLEQPRQPFVSRYPNLAGKAAGPCEQVRHRGWKIP